MEAVPTLTEDQARDYLFEIISECGIVDECYQLFTHAVQEWLKYDDPLDNSLAHVHEASDAERMMRAAIEGILAASGRVSLFLYPENQSKAFGKARAARLLGMLGIGELHPLSDRRLRNDWMHLDERLDREVKRGKPVPLGYAIRTSRPYSMQPESHTFRLLDPRAGCVYLLGTPYMLADLVGAVAHVNQQAVLALAPYREELGLGVDDAE